MSWKSHSATRFIGFITVLGCSLASAAQKDFSATEAFEATDGKTVLVVGGVVILFRRRKRTAQTA